jgi:hypothetical protein
MSQSASFGLRSDTEFGPSRISKVILLVCYVPISIPDRILYSSAKIIRVLCRRSYPESQSRYLVVPDNDQPDDQGSESPSQ